MNNRSLRHFCTHLLFSVMLLLASGILSHAANLDGPPSNNIAANWSGKLWYFGDGAGLDFRSSPPLPLKDNVYLSGGGSATICDSEGRLLFYTDGAQVWNREHLEMLGGDALTGSAYAEQPAIILPAPGNSELFYIFTTSTQLGLYYSLVDMRLDSGLGGVTEKNIKLWSDAAGKMTAVLHKNGYDIWIIVPSRKENRFYAYLLTESGVSKDAIITTLGIAHSKTEFDWAGFLKASPDGRNLALSVFDPGFFELFDFDAESGKLSEALFLGDYESAYGLEFSPDGTKLYATVVSWVHREIYQFDLEAEDIRSSVMVIGESDAETRLRALQIGPDGRIYVARENESHLGLIENPNLNGMSAGYRDKGIYLNGRLCRNDLPTFLASFFLPPIIRLVIDDPQAKEGENALAFTIALSEASRSDINVHYQTRDESARAGQDYLPLSGELMIPAGETAARLSVTLLDDTDFDEGPETLTLQLSDPLRVELQKNSGKGTILDNDLVTLSAQSGEAEEGAGPLIFPLTLSQPSRSDVSVKYRSVEGSAQEGREYQRNAGTLVIPAGENSAFIEIDIADDALDEESKSLLLELYEPSNAKLETPEVEGTIHDDDPPPSIVVEDAVLLEKNEALTFPVRLSAVSALDVRLEYRTEDESATAGEDYQAASGAIFIPAGATLGTILVDVNDDALDETHERFNVLLSRPVNASIANAQSSGIIKDNDDPPTLALTDTSADEGSGTVDFVLNLSSPSGRDIAVAYRTLSGTAKAGIDYEERSGTLTIPAGSLGALLSLPLHDDADYERDEHFSVLISETQHVSLLQSQCTATIRNDDDPPAISISDAGAAEDIGDLEFKISLSGASYEDVSLRAASLDGSATIAGNDYRLLPETEIVIPAGETEFRVRVPIYEDHLPEGDERFFVQGYEPLGATLLKERGEGLIVDNDALPKITISDGVLDEAGGTVTFVVSLSETSALPVIVHYAAKDGTAVHNADYAPIEGMLAIAPQHESGTIAVNLILAKTQQRPRYFRIVLRDLHNAVFEKYEGIGRIE